MFGGNAHWLVCAAPKGFFSGRESCRKALLVLVEAYTKLTTQAMLRQPPPLFGLLRLVAGDS
jgi:hypothetical protein